MITCLPRNWTSEKLSAACLDIIGGGTPSREKTEYFGGDIVWLTPTEIPKDRIATLADSRERITELGFKSSSARLIPKDSVLLTSRASIGYVAIAGCDVTTNQGFASFIPTSAINNLFLAYWLWGNKQLIEKEATGTTFKEISKAKLKEFILPIPPLNEQKRITTKLEELFTNLDAGIAALKKTKVLIKRYRQSVLKSAFSGKLTQEWQLVKLKEVSSAIGGYAFRSLDFKKTGAYQVLKIANIKTAKINLSANPAFLDTVSPEIFKKYGLRSGDCIITLTGTRKKRDYGFVAMLKEEHNLLLNQRLARLRFDDSVLPEYAQYALRSEVFQNSFFAYETGNVGQGNVSMRALTEESIPIPPLEIQKQIVEGIEFRFSIADATEKTIDEGLKQAGRLRQSILKKAFEGKLVPQDPKDEPAGKLLARIKAEKAKTAESKTQIPRKKVSQ